MPNAISLANLESYVPYVSDGMRQWTQSLRRNLPPDVIAADSLTLYVSIALTTTAVAIKATPGKVHGVYLQSLGALAFLSLWDVAQGSVTVGTTSQQFAMGVGAASGLSQAAYLVGTGNGTAPNWATAITGAVTTTVTGNSAAATLPLVIVAYS